MTDYYALLRESIACTARDLLHAPIDAAQVDCPAIGCAARSAAPLAFRADAKQWASVLERERSAFSCLGAPLMEQVSCGGGHLLFAFGNAFYTKAVQHVLGVLPPVADPGPVGDDGAVAARALYTARRMWMLARRASGTPFCPENAPVQRALLYALALTEQNISRRALALRLLEASEALLTMFRSAPPVIRPYLMRQAAHVGDAAARLFIFGVQRFTDC